MSGPKKPLRKGANSGKPGGDPPPRGAPPQSSVLTELSIDLPKGNRYRILRTTEKDLTDVDKKPPT